MGPENGEQRQRLADMLRRETKDTRREKIRSKRNTERNTDEETRKP